MTIRNKISTSSTSSLESIAIATLIYTSALSMDKIKPEMKTKPTESIFSNLRDYEAKLIDFSKFGSESLVPGTREKKEVLEGFVVNYLEKEKSIPGEFEKILNENWKDFLV